MGLTEHLRVIWRRKWRIVGVALVLAGTVFARTSTSRELFEAESLLAAVPAGGAGTADDLARSYARLATTRPLVATAIEAEGIDLGVSEAVELIEAQPAGAGFIELRARARSPRQAEELAGAVASVLVDRVRARQAEARDEALAPLTEEAASLERQLASNDLAADAPVRGALLVEHQELTGAIAAARLRPLDRVEVASPARASTQPVSPQPARDALLMFLAALGGFALVAVVIEALSDRLSTERPAEEAARIAALPVLARIPRAGGAEAIEAFRTLRTSLMFMSTSDRLRTLAVVSVEPGAGKTFVALNLAREAAALDVPVATIDGDLRRPSIHDRLGLERSPGLSEALATADPGAALSPDRTAAAVIDEWLRVIPSGAPVADPSGLFGGRAFRDALDAMTWAELVVVDTPAAGLFADALAIASQCDATLVVVDAQTTRRRALRNLADDLRQVSAQPIGIVVNRVDPTPRPSYYEKASGRRKEPSQRSTAAATS